VTALTERIPVEEISARAHEVRFGRTVLTVIAAVFFGIGWIIAKAWLAVAWCAVAVRVGWQEGRSGTAVTQRGPAGPG
jgi:hypothetical protein